MTAEVFVGKENRARLQPHPLRAIILGEIHARLFATIERPSRVQLFAFDTTVDAAKRDRASLADFCPRRNLEPLKPSAKQHRVVFGGVLLRWEQHSEFTTYTWE